VRGKKAWGTGTSWGRTSTYAVHGLAVLLAFVTHKFDAPCREERATGRRVAHLDEARVEVDLGGEGADRDEGGGSDAEDGRDGLVEEALVAVGGLLEDEHVAAGALRRPDLHTHRPQSQPRSREWCFIFNGLQKKKLCRVTWLWTRHDMGDESDTRDVAREREQDEDLITMLYLLALLLCVLMDQGAFACLWLIALLSVADMVCKL
jgi:hypothetical protein